MKEDPQVQMEAHHYCKQVNEGFVQCALFDGNTESANLNGIEYIIPQELFDKLPEEGKQYWHPHNGEILSGQLVTLGVPEDADHTSMKSKMNSYGKTFHLWHSNPFGMEAESFPFGPPQLAWSFNRFGQAKEGLIDQRDREMNIDTEERRVERQDLIPTAEPQEGVGELDGEFIGPTAPNPGVVEK